MRVICLLVVTAILLMATLTLPQACLGEEVLFADNFDSGLSDKWRVAGLSENDYRIREGGLEIKLTPGKAGESFPMLKVSLPFTTADSVVASVEIADLTSTLQRGERAGVSFNDPAGTSFTARVTNIDGYVVFAPGQVDFIGRLGEEGDPGKYTVKYWPADQEFGPLKILVHGHYAYFQVGPSSEGKYLNFFHSAVRPADAGLGFGLFAIGESGDEDRWVRFDNFRITRP